MQEETIELLEPSFNQNAPNAQRIKHSSHCAARQQQNLEKSVLKFLLIFLR